MTLRQAGIINNSVKFAKIMLSGSIDRAVTVSGLGASKGAKEAIAAAGGKVED